MVRHHKNNNNNTNYGRESATVRHIYCGSGRRFLPLSNTATDDYVVGNARVGPNPNIPDAEKFTLDKASLTGAITALAQTRQPSFRAQIFLV
jgi:hypothetical protein